jgi:hypothetical protein
MLAMLALANTLKNENVLLSWFRVTPYNGTQSNNEIKCIIRKGFLASYLKLMVTMFAKE